MKPQELKEFRLKTGKSQLMFGLDIDRTQGTISAWETGKEPIPKYMERIIQRSICWSCDTVLTSTDKGRGVCIQCFAAEDGPYEEDEADEADEQD